MISRALRHCQGFARILAPSITVQQDVKGSRQVGDWPVDKWTRFGLGLTSFEPDRYNTAIGGLYNPLFPAEFASRPMPPMPLPAQQGETGRLRCQADIYRIPSEVEPSN